MEQQPRRPIRIVVAYEAQLDPTMDWLDKPDGAEVEREAISVCTIDDSQIIGIVRSIADGRFARCEAKDYPLSFRLLGPK